MSWKNVELGNLCDVLDSQRKPITKRDRTVGEYPYYGATGIVDYVENYIFDEKLVLIGEDGAKWESGEKTAFIANGKYWVNNHAHVIRPKRELLLDEWLVYYFYYKDLKEFVTGLTVPKLNQGQLRIIPIPLPPLNTQKKLVAKLDAIFAEIDKATAAAEANANNAEALCQSYLTKIFEYDSEGWKDAALGNLYKVASSKRVLKSDWKSEGVPFYRGREITSLSKFGFVENDLFITEEMYAEYSRTYGVPLADDIMITAIGTIGNTYIVKEGDKFYFKDASVLWLKKEADIDSKFVNYWFKSRHFFSQLDVGLGATVDTLTIGKVQGLQIKIPTVSTQKDVVAKLDSVSSEIAKSIKSYTDKVNELGKLKDSILRQAFSGELVKE